MLTSQIAMIGTQRSRSLDFPAKPVLPQGGLVESLQGLANIPAEEAAG
ncbi:hypothetical protein [Vasconcelosia minhoensis]|nr:hypothetical protein [Romeria gracilis]